MKEKLNWQRHACGGLVVNIPKELGGGLARIVPKAFGGTKARLRLHDNPMTSYFYRHQFYASIKEAKSALLAKLERGHLA